MVDDKNNDNIDIFIVEDDFTLANEIKISLEKYGYKAERSSNLENITEEALLLNPKLILMDVNLPFRDGFQWCSEIRRFLKVPIIFISSRNTDMDIIMSINMGGDDYIIKPFSIQVLIAKVQALFRRAYSYNNSSSPAIKSLREVTLNMAGNTVMYHGNIIELSKNEFKIMNILMTKAGTVVTRDEIMDILWSTDEFIGENTLTVNINRLRSRLKSIGVENFIKTKKGQGYIIDEY